MKEKALCLVVALPAEAKPVIRALGLKRLQPDGAFPRYAGGAMTLVLSGPGQEAAGAAVAYMQRAVAGDPVHWINLGIAGHARLEPGATLLADLIVDTTTDETWTLTPIAGLPVTERGALHCVAQAEARYAATAAYDMESAAIARTLDAGNTFSRLHVVKVISDNPAHPSRRINARMVTELIEGALPTLQTLIHRLLPSSDSDECGD